MKLLFRTFAFTALCAIALTSFAQDTPRGPETRRPAADAKKPSKSAGVQADVQKRSGQIMQNRSADAPAASRSAKQVERTKQRVNSTTKR
jgi:hypothetical protein